MKEGGGEGRGLGVAGAIKGSGYNVCQCIYTTYRSVSSIWRDVQDTGDRSPWEQW